MDEAVKKRGLNWSSKLVWSRCHFMSLFFDYVCSVVCVSVYERSFDFNYTFQNLVWSSILYTLCLWLISKRIHELSILIHLWSVSFITHIFGIRKYHVIVEIYQNFHLFYRSEDPSSSGVDSGSREWILKGDENYKNVQRLLGLDQLNYEYSSEFSHL